MPTPFRTVIREIAKRVNALKSEQPAIAEASYIASPITVTQIDDPVYNLSFLQDIVADVHSDLVMAIATCVDPINGIGNHPWRNHFPDVTASITHGGNLPMVGASNKTIIGALGRPYDALNVNKILTPASIQRVLAYKNFNSLYTNNPYFYTLNGSKVYHTTQNIVFDCCVYERSDVVTLIGANGNFGAGVGTVPDVLTPALIAGGVVNAIVAGEYAEQVGPYAAYYMSVREMIASGGIMVPGLPVRV